MIIPLLLYVSAFLSVLFFVMGVLSLIRLFPIMNSFKTEGKIKDARITCQNVLGDDFGTAKIYTYFTYEYKGVVHGSSTISTENSAFARNIAKSLSERFEKEGEFSVDVFVNKSDPRKAYLQGPEDINIKKLSLGIIFTILSAVIYFLM